MKRAAKEEAMKRRRSTVPVRMALFCCECGAHCETLLIDGRIDPKQLHTEHQWVMSVVTPPGQGYVVIAALCGDCAKKVHHPGVIAAARGIFDKSGGDA